MYTYVSLFSCDRVIHQHHVLVKRTENRRAPGSDTTKVILRNGGQLGRGDLALSGLALNGAAGVDLAHLPVGVLPGGVGAVQRQVGLAAAEKGDAAAPRSANS